MSDSNILSFYQDGEFRKLPENEKQSIIENYFDKSIAPSLSASEEDKAVARTNFMKTHELSGGFDSRVLDWYKDPEFASLPSEEKATVLGNFYDKMSGKAAQYLDPEVREQQRELFVAQNMLLPEDKGGWIDAAVDVAKNLGHGN